MQHPFARLTSWRPLLGAVGGMLLLVPAYPATVAPSAQARAQATAERIMHADEDPDNWRSHGRGYDETRHSPLRQINADTVARLGIAWFHDLDTNRGQEATPLVADGRMYTTSAWSKVQAFDAVSGALLWQYDPHVPGEAGAKACCDVVNRGVALWDGKIYVGTLDGRLIALQAASGKLRWSVPTVDTTKGYTITGAPRVIKGRVIIGNGGAEFGVRGYVSAYDADTGKLVWRFYTVPGKPGERDHAASDAVLERLAAPTWNGRWWENGGGGGTVWDSMAYDPALDLLYVGVGNSSYWRQSLRSPDGGDNLFVASILALRPETGEYVWHYQQTPGDQWDYTSAQHMILADLKLAGTTRKVLLQAPKNGFFYVIDRTDGQLISAEPFVPVNWASKIDLRSGRPVMNPDADYSKSGKAWLAMPGALGAHDWMPMAYDPATGLVYIPAQEIGFPYKADPDFSPKPKGVNLGVDLGALNLPDDPKIKAAVRASMKGYLIAWDPRSQREVWRAPHAGPWNGGVLSTAGGLVFQGDLDGMLNAYDAHSGALLWSRDLQTGIVAPPVTWARYGRQYVTVLAGWGGAFPLLAGEMSWSSKGALPNRSRVITFALDATGTLPPAAPAAVRVLQPPPQFADAATIALGQKAYDRTCIACHGGGAAGGGLIPDLRYSPVISDDAAWTSIVADGALASRGMIGFRENFNAEEITALRAYVIARAHAAQPTAGLSP